MARPTRGRLRTAVLCGALLASAALAAPLAPPAGARTGDGAATPSPDDPAHLVSRLRTLYLQTESATAAYDQAGRVAAAQRAKAETIDRQLAAQKVRIAAGRDQAGLMAREMYREGGLSPYLSMLTGETPQDFFRRKHLLDRVAGRQKDVLARLAGGRAELAALNTRAQRALDAAQHAQAVQAAKKAQVESGLRQVEGLLAGLTGEQIARMQALAVSPGPPAGAPG